MAPTPTESKFPSLVWPFTDYLSPGPSVASLGFPHFQPDSASKLVWPYFNASPSAIVVELRADYPAVLPCERTSRSCPSVKSHFLQIDRSTLIWRSTRDTSLRLMSALQLQEIRPTRLRTMGNRAPFHRWYGRTSRRRSPEYQSSLPTNILSSPLVREPFELGLTKLDLRTDRAVYPHMEIYPGHTVAFDENTETVSSTSYPLVWPFTEAARGTFDVASLAFPHFAPDVASRTVWPFLGASQSVSEIEIVSSSEPCLEELF